MSAYNVASLHADEARYRSLGKYELAVQYQRQADLVESGGDPVAGIYSIFDRGAIEPLKHGHVGHLTAFELPSGLAWCLTPDLLMDLWVAIAGELEITPDEFFELGKEEARRLAVRDVMPLAANHYWQEGWEANEGGKHRNPYTGLAKAVKKQRGDK